MADAARELVSRMLVDEFLEWPGDGTAKRFQLIDGVPQAMSPASSVHGRIQMRLGSLIDRHLGDRGSPCAVIAEPAVQPRLRAATNVRVPDLGVTCSPLEPGQVIVPEPILLIEILSPGNERSTRENAWAYATIPSVLEILLVQSTAVRAELYRRLPDGSWPVDPAEIEAGDTLRLESIDLALPIEEAYAGTPLL